MIGADTQFLVANASSYGLITLESGPLMRHTLLILLVGCWPLEWTYSLTWAPFSHMPSFIFVRVEGSHVGKSTLNPTGLKLVTFGTLPPTIRLSHALN